MNWRGTGIKPRTRITKQDVACIKRLLLDGHSESAIAERYGCATSTIASIRRGHTWTLTEAAPTSEPAGATRPDTS